MGKRLERLKKGKMDRTTFWIMIVVIWCIEIALLLAGYDYYNEALPAWRLICLMVVLVFYLLAVILRLRDAGKGIGLVVICFIIPVFMFVIGCWPSVENEEVAVEEQK